MEMRRSSGILLHPASIPGPAGIGDIGPAAQAFVEQLARAGQRLWQILPLGPTGYGDSPYAPFSSFAGNELLISLESLEAEGLLTQAETRPPAGLPIDRIDYGAVLAWKRPLLDRAAAAFLGEASPVRKAAFDLFRTREAGWLDDYALFRAIKDDYDRRAAENGGGSIWYESWPEALVLREPGRLAAERSERLGAVRIYEVLQFFFDEQWRALKTKANSLGISIVGDLPIFVAADSADIWSHPELFMLDTRRRPLEVAGVPPDYFATDGQLWGNPLYDWEANRAEDYAWWIRRIEAGLSRHDVLRIDHFRGFEAYYAIPADAANARRGVWRKGPGKELFAALGRALGRTLAQDDAGSLPIIAEDLGFITEEVIELRDSLGFPGMRILQFAFDAHESGTAFDPANTFLPHNYTEHTVVYTGTHDNDTVQGWWDRASEEERAYAGRYFGFSPDSESPARLMHGTTPVAEAFIREAMKSTAAWAVIPMQDLLGLGSESRLNTPSTLGGNWTWRMESGAFNEGRAAGLKKMSTLYGRA